MYKAFPTRLVGKVLPLLLGVYAIGSGEGVRAPAPHARFAEPTELVARSASLRVDVADSSITLVSDDGKRSSRMEIAIVHAGVARALSGLEIKTRRKHGEIIIQIGGRAGIDAPEELPPCNLRFSLDRVHDAFNVALEGPPEVSLRFDVARPHAVFVPGTGVLADVGTVNGRAVVLDSEPLPWALASADMPLYATLSGDTPESTHLVMTAGDASQGAARDKPRLALSLVAATADTELASRTFAVMGEEVKPLKLVVTGATQEARVFGSDDDGHPMLSMRARPGEHVTVQVPARVVRYYAAADRDDTSSPIRFEPGLPWELTLDVSPGGELHVRVVDADRDAPATARIVVHGVEGTLDPSFGPDYRASGAGPLMDSQRGEVVTPLPIGRYRVLATKGLEYNVDAETIEIQSGKKKTVELSLRRVIDTPNMVACDLHVHARPSFDTPVMPEDRVLSLVSAGIEFAVPTEHNIVGDYSPALGTLGMTKDLSFVPGVEVTTYNPRFGHFGVFPYPLGAPPPYKGTTIAAVFAASKGNDPNRVLVVHHPRLPKQIGYFDVVGFEPTKPQTFGKVRMDFDALEVFNGYEKDSSEKIQRVLADYYALLDTGRRFAATGSSDSHRIQYQWAGYPRTMAIVPEDKGGSPQHAVDTQAVVSAIKHAHASVTSGPIVEISLDGKGPGDELALHGKTQVTAYVRVRAAPWVDVTSVEVVAAGKVLATIPITSRPTHIGKESGDEAELAARVLRFEGNVPLTFAPGTKWVLAIARGERKLDDVLPFMPVVPIGLTNPVWISGI